MLVYCETRARAMNGPSADAGVAVLGNLLVGLLGSTRGGALDGLRDVVDGLLGGLHCEVLVVCCDEELFCELIDE